MSGWLRIIGLGPGPAEWLTPEALHWLRLASDIVGYAPYVAAVPEPIAARRHPSDNGVEVARASEALRMAAEGGRVAVVSGGDAGIFGMAAAVFEAMEKGPPEWHALDIAVIPGLTALLAAAARVGAPLGHDFCVLSLSDRLKPWSVIERRLRAASEGDFALAIYNPASHTRQTQLAQAIALLAALRGPETPLIRATHVGRPEEDIETSTLGAFDCRKADMRTLLIVGSSRTRKAGRWIYTPRSYEEAP